MAARQENSMAAPSADVDGVDLRRRLMAAEPMQRVAALHDLECQLERAAQPPGARLAQAVQEFVARGMPFYSSVDPHYLAWVDRAVEYWGRLQPRGESAGAAVAAGPRRATDPVIS
jgi:hypothetical protein